MARKYNLLERYLRERLSGQGEVTLTFEGIEQILKAHLPGLAFQDRGWWGVRKQDTRPQAIAGWIIDAVDLDQKWVRFVRQ